MFSISFRTKCLSPRKTFKYDPSSYFHQFPPILYYSYETCSAENTFQDSKYDQQRSYMANVVNSGIVHIDCFMDHSVDQVCR